jgi:hypothetical protein
VDKLRDWVPDDGADGDRRRVGVKRMQAVAELQEPVALMLREKPKRRTPRGERTDVGHWDGLIRSSEESPVMGLERRGRVRQSYERSNWQQEDLDACDRQAVQHR